MDPLRIAVRAVFVFVTVLALVRASGKRTVKHGSLFDFAVAVVIGDMFDDALWAEVPLSAFVVACGTLIAAHLIADTLRYRAGRLT